jgi:hypothetical protein
MSAPAPATRATKSGVKPCLEARYSGVFAETQTVPSASSHARARSGRSSPARGAAIKIGSVNSPMHCGSEPRPCGSEPRHCGTIASCTFARRAPACPVASSQCARAPSQCSLPSSLCKRSACIFSRAKRSVQIAQCMRELTKFAVARAPSRCARAPSQCSYASSQCLRAPSHCSRTSSQCSRASSKCARAPAPLDAQERRRTRK